VFFTIVAIVAAIMITIIIVIIVTITVAIIMSVLFGITVAIMMSIINAKAKTGYVDVDAASRMGGAG